MLRFISNLLPGVALEKEGTHPEERVEMYNLVWDTGKEECF